MEKRTTLLGVLIILGLVSASTGITVVVASNSRNAGAAANGWNTGIEINWR